MNKAQEMLEATNKVLEQKRMEAVIEADKMYGEVIPHIEQSAQKGELKSRFAFKERCDLELEDALKDRFQEEGFRCTISSDNMSMIVNWENARG